MRVALGLVALLLAASSPALPGFAQAPAVVPRLAELQAGYGSEAWKDEPPLAPLAGALPLPLPQEGPLGVYENPYLGRPHQGPQPWLGYNLTAVFELADEAGTPLASATHYVRARLVTEQGDIPAKLARLAPGRFAAQFDLDGEAGTELPEAPPGPARLAVDVYEDAPAPGAADRRVARGEFRVEVVQPRLDVGGFLLGDAALGYGDLGAGNQTLVQPRLARPGESFTLISTFGVPDAPAALAAWRGARGAVLVEGRTDASGVFAASVDAAQLVGGDPSGLAVVAAYLTGEAGRAGNAVVAVPVSDHATRIATMDYEARGAGPLAGPLDTLLVGVEDLSATLEQAPVRGSLYVLDAGGQVTGSVPFEPQGFLPGQEAREARVPASMLPRLNTTYRLLAMLYDSAGRLYSLAQAVRGFDVVIADEVGQPFVPGEVTVVVRNYNTNLDAVTDDGLAFRVRLNVTGLPNGSVEREFTLIEGGEARLTIPYIADVGTYPLNVTAVGGEFRREASATLRIDAPRSALPGFEPWLAALALAGLALHRRRTRA